MGHGHHSMLHPEISSEAQQQGPRCGKLALLLPGHSCSVTGEKLSVFREVSLAPFPSVILISLHL